MIIMGASQDTQVPILACLGNSDACELQACRSLTEPAVNMIMVALVAADTSGHTPNSNISGPFTMPPPCTATTAKEEQLVADHEAPS
jgi:hypothetical protein